MNFSDFFRNQKRAGRMARAEPEFTLLVAAALSTVSRVTTRKPAPLMENAYKHLFKGDGGARVLMTWLMTGAV